MFMPKDDIGFIADKNFQQFLLDDYINLCDVCEKVVDKKAWEYFL